MSITICYKEKLLCWQLRDVLMYEYNYNKTSLGVSLTLSLSNRLVVVHGHHGGKPGGRRVDLTLEQKLGAVAGSLHLICKMEAETARLDLVWTLKPQNLFPITHFQQGHILESFWNFHQLGINHSNFWASRDSYSNPNKRGGSMVPLCRIWVTGLPSLFSWTLPFVSVDLEESYLPEEHSVA